MGGEGLHRPSVRRAGAVADLGQWYRSGGPASASGSRAVRAAQPSAIALLLLCDYYGSVLTIASDLIPLRSAYTRSSHCPRIAL